MIDIKAKVGTLAALSILSFSMFATAALASHGNGGDFGSLMRTRFVAVLTGQNEVPGPGDPDGFGVARVNVLTNQICVDLRVRRIATPTAAHIHEATSGAAGPVVVTLPTPDQTGHASGCVNVATAEAQDIKDNPGGYYVNVHTGEYPGGAVRGQIY